jgi:purine-binding chemotaxis protein CheW
MAELVVAVVRGERFGVPIARVREIQALGVTLPHVPGLPAYWVGLMNLRGRLYPVLDLGSYLGLPIPDRRKAEPVLSQVEGGGSAQTRRNEADAHTSKIILVSAIGLDVGLLVDDVPGVRQLAQAEIGPPLMEIGGGKRPIIAGVTSDLLSVLDLEALLSSASLQRYWRRI